MMSPWPNFTFAELRCKCGKCGSTGAEMDADFMRRLQQLREHYGKPISLSSAYRCPKHPAEAKKEAPGEHCTGKAVDIAVQGAEAYQVLKLAVELGFPRIGVSQKGSGRFIHIGTASGAFPSPALWSY